MEMEKGNAMFNFILGALMGVIIGYPLHPVLKVLVSKLLNKVRG